MPMALATRPMMPNGAKRMTHCTIFVTVFAKSLSMFFVVSLAECSAMPARQAQPRMPM